MGRRRVSLSKDSSGERVRRGTITQSGNAQLRRLIVESVWSYRHLLCLGAKLHKLSMKQMAAGNEPGKFMTAIGRELMGFIWAIGVKAEAACLQPKAE